MRENATKREGLGMGRYRTSKHNQLPQNIKWVKEGDWAISLGVPVGNDLDTARWWDQKIKAVRVRRKEEGWTRFSRNESFNQTGIEGAQVIASCS